MKAFDNQVVVVTGGGGGIGGATCRRFGAAGAKVAVLDRDLAAAQKVADGITGAGGQAAAFQCDITDRTSVDAALLATEQQLGAIDVLSTTPAGTCSSPSPRPRRTSGRS